MEIGSLRGLNLGQLFPDSRAVNSTLNCQDRGNRITGTFKGLQKESEEETDSVEEYDELDTNKDGVVDADELEAAGIRPSGGGFQSSEDFLSLLGVDLSEGVEKI